MTNDNSTRQRSMSPPAVAVALSFLVASLIFTIPAALAQTFPVTYDANGNRLTGFGLEFEYDGFNRLSNVKNATTGEVIEEFHVLRELVILDLYRNPPLGGRLPLSLREVLRLNRALDRGVTHASVGHTDAMFFQFFEEDADSVTMSGAEVAAEAEAQLEAIRRELQEILEPESNTSRESVREN